MTDVVIFGLFDNRLQIERVLDEDVRITAYSDFTPLFDADDGKALFNVKRFEYKPFISPDKLKDENPDHVIICNKDRKISNTIKQRLISLGLPEEKIIPSWFLLFGESAYQSPYKEYLDSDDPFEGAIFGMSYSRRALRNDLLDHSCFKFSVSGFDLRAHELYIKELVNNKKFVQDTKYIILDLPYYSPNWDTSCSNQMLYRMQVYDEFDEWGHYKELRKNAEKEIAQWRAMKKLISKKYETTLSSLSNNFGSTKKVKPEEFEKGMDKIWKKLHDDTIKENTERFANICRLLKPLGIPVIITVFPFAPSYVEKNPEVIENMKKIFYDMMEAGKKELSGLKILDYFSKPDIKIVDQYFYSPSHMNEYGALAITESVNRNINSICFKEEEKSEENDISYGVYVRSVGWLPWVKENTVTGTNGTYKGLKGIRAVLKKTRGVDISYAVHEPGVGWGPYESNGKSAVIKKDCGINALKISVSPAADDVKDIPVLKYKVYTTESGWGPWVGNNEIAGSVESDSQIEAVRISKGGA